MNNQALTTSQLEALQKLISQATEFKAGLAKAATNKRTVIGNVLTPVKPYLAAALRKATSGPMLWVTSTSQRAEQLYQDLQPLLLSNWRVLVFPEAEDDTAQSTPWRLQVLQALQDNATPTVDLEWADPSSAKFQATNGKGDKLIIIAPIPALFRPTLDNEYLKKNKTDLSVGEGIDLKTLVEILSEQGYQRTSLVEKRGDMAVRGGILDIYPLTGQPVRIELFGDEIEEMRYFDIDTQCSVGTTEQVTLVPASEGDQKVPGSQAYFTDILQRCFPDTLVCLEDRDEILLATREYYQEWTTDINEVLVEHVNSLLRPFKQIEVFTGILNENNCESRDFLNLPFSELPVFENHIDELLDTIPQWQKANDRTIIISRQYERLRELCEERGLRDMRFGDSTDALARPLSYGQVWLIQGYQSQGWCLQLPDGKLRLLTDHELTGQRRRRYSLQQQQSRNRSILHLDELNEGDLVVHIDFGIGKFVGVVNEVLFGARRDMLRIQYADATVSMLPDRLDRLQKYHGIKDTVPQLSHLKSRRKWTAAKQQSLESAQELAQELLQINAMREQAHGISYPNDTPWQREFAQAFPYKETPDQMRAIREVDHDLSLTRPMDRLICGDVGFGKTEVALRAAFKVAIEGRQVAVLVPTTVLAKQHYQTFSERMASFPVHLALLSRVKTAKEQKQILADLAEGKIDIVIGTHRLLSKDVSFKHLGMIIVDEEHRFGVRHKERLKELRSSVEVLTMSATPIPRTLQMSLYGMRELSLIETPPAERLPIKTFLQKKSKDIIRASINRELRNGGQVFFLHNRINDIDRTLKELKELIPQARIEVAHGQMSPTRLEQIMSDFYDGLFDVLVSTTIIENGLDIPNVNTILIDNAQNFGLAQLYQLRGRVGRSTKQGYCYLLIPSERELNEQAQERLETLRDFTHLGAGYQIARRDMEIRGAGDMLGSRQSGHIQAVGFDLYCRMLREAVETLTGTKSADAPVRKSEDESTQLELPIPTSIPDTYVDNPQQKISFYKRIAMAVTCEQIDKLEAELVDRYGRLPQETDNLMKLARLKLKATALFIVKIKVDGDRLYIVVPFLKSLQGQNRLSKRQAFQLGKASRGWNVHWYPGEFSLCFASLYGVAAGNINYPPASELISRIEAIVDMLATLEKEYA